jgi:hypothetical protein
MTTSITLTAADIAAIEEPTIYDITDRLPTANPHLRKKRPLKAIGKIVVHIDDQVRGASYDPISRYIGQARFHINKNWQEDPSKPKLPGFGLMYHYKIAGDGRIFRTAPETDVLWHASSWNREGLAICVDARETQAPTAEQVNALHHLLLWLCYRRPDFPAGRRDVYGHTEEESTTKSCPAKVLRYAQRFRKGEW